MFIINQNHFRASGSQMVGAEIQYSVMWCAASIFITIRYVFPRSAVTLALIPAERIQLGFK